jgi:hypothetical protein
LKGDSIVAEHVTKEREERIMNIKTSNRFALIATLIFFAAFSTELLAQDAGSTDASPPPDASSAAAAPQQAAAALTGDQQSAANSALCSAIGSHFPNPASAGPSALSDPGVISAAASSFAGSTNLPLAGATDMLKGYVAQHATDILASCATTNATNAAGSAASSVTSKIPGAGSLPSVPNMP